MIHAENDEPVFRIDNMENWHDTHTLYLATKRTNLTVFLKLEQVKELSFALTSYLDSLTRTADMGDPNCETCQGAGTLAVWDGVSAYSGDDACPNCFPNFVK